MLPNSNRAPAFRRTRGSRHGGGHGESNWAVSYVDMLTLLLCFFIIFFSSEKIKVSGTALKKIEAKFQSREPSSVQAGAENSAGTTAGSGSGGRGRGAAGSGLGAGAGMGGVGTGNGSGAWSYMGGDTPATGGAGSGTSLGIPKIAAISKQIDERSNWFSNKSVNGSMIELQFEDVSFFDSGSNKLTPDGVRVVKETIDLLEPFKGAVKITVQGHTDSRNVVHSKARANDNWELSVIRATTVLKMFRERGYPQHLLSAEGFAHTRTPASVDLSKQRRITLKIEEIAQ